MASSPTTVPTITTPLTRLLNIKHPVLLAGMAHATTPLLCATVSNAGGLGCLGGLGYTPTQLRALLAELRSLLDSPNLPFGVDLALPQVGDGARKTNHDYTHGQLDELVEVTIEAGAKLFVSAVGIPPSRTIKRLHEAKILVMNMVGAPKHAERAFEAGVDIVCAQGSEGGGHTGDIPTCILIPAVVDIAKRYRSPLTGEPALVVAAGGIYDGRGLASALMMGATGVWAGTRFVASEEAGASSMHKKAVVTAGFEDTARTLVVSGRPLRVRTNDYIREWECERQEEMKRLLEAGIVPMQKDLDEGSDNIEVDMPFLMGQVAGIIGDIKPAGVIVEEMVEEAVETLRQGWGYINKIGKDSKL
ncbi:MAG: hypothetical protein M1834_006414 [Cirrosporium novae-zelandiae]|nr:MAG: hypothetical protein M1834_006414 [Cirrosporium novae-zelandiae]